MHQLHALTVKSRESSSAGSQVGPRVSRLVTHAFHVLLQTPVAQAGLRAELLSSPRL